MRIAIDNLKIIENIKVDADIIYVFKDEKLEDLLKTNLHCINKKYVDYVDINTTEYDLYALKKVSKNEEITPVEKNQNKFVIIIPNCNNNHGNINGKTFFQTCIESILNQTYKNYELIIVDDMSSDNSVEIVKEYQKEHKIHLIQNKRKKFNGGSRNVGIEYALENLDFNYFCFLDSDDWWKDTTVLETINSLLDDHELLVMGGEFKGINGRQLNHVSNYEDLFSLNSNVWCTAWCRVIRKDKIVYFCENTLMEDRVWSYRQADNIDINKVVNCNKICYVWNRTNNNSVSTKKGGWWEASAYCHIGHQLQFLEELKHEEMRPLIEDRIRQCIQRVNRRCI